MINALLLKTRMRIPALLSAPALWLIISSQPAQAAHLLERWPDSPYFELYSALGASNAIPTPGISLAEINGRLADAWPSSNSAPFAPLKSWRPGITLEAQAELSYGAGFDRSSCGVGLIVDGTQLPQDFSNTVTGGIDFMGVPALSAFSLSNPSSDEASGKCRSDASAYVRVNGFRILPTVDAMLQWNRETASEAETLELKLDIYLLTRNFADYQSWSTERLGLVRDGLDSLVDRTPSGPRHDNLIRLRQATDAAIQGAPAPYTRAQLSAPTEEMIATFRNDLLAESSIAQAYLNRYRQLQPVFAAQADDSRRKLQALLIQVQQAPR